MRDAACCRAATLCDGVGDGDGDGVASPTLIGGTRGGEEGEIKELHCGGRSATCKEKKRRGRNGYQIDRESRYAQNSMHAEGRGGTDGLTKHTPGKGGSRRGRSWN